MTRHPCRLFFSLLGAALFQLLLIPTNAWIMVTPPDASPGNHATSSNSGTSLDSSSSNGAAAVAASPLDGVSEFEQWFTSLGAEATCLATIRHSAFGSLRGLECTDRTMDSEKEQNSVLQIPKSIVLATNAGDDDWDATLAKQLWEECLKGKTSDIYGYCSLLTRGRSVGSTSAAPTPVAPNTLRRWTEDQRSALSDSQKGRMLLTKFDEQAQLWRTKYRSTGAASAMTWEQFEWCMEVVHSRAFRGNYGLSPVRTIGSILAPFVASAAGIAYFWNNPRVEESVLIGLTFLASTPILANIVSPDQGEVVLLPLIDSANHLESADSAIEYNPVVGTFSLQIGSNCLIQEEEKKTQLYITYGRKTDAELLLNYGFLPGVPCKDGEDESSRNAQREQLANEFLQRNK